MAVMLALVGEVRSDLDLFQLFHVGCGQSEDGEQGSRGGIAQVDGPMARRTVLPFYLSVKSVQFAGLPEGAQARPT
jgi:hypothetical protein